MKIIEAADKAHGRQFKGLSTQPGNVDYEGVSCNRTEVLYCNCPL